MLGLVNDFDPKKDAVPKDKLTALDAYMFANFQTFKDDLLTDYEEYHYSSLYKRVMNFVSTDLSAFYLNVAKDIVYIDSQNSFNRRSMQTVIYQVLKELLILLTPILVHTCEEAWKSLPGVEGSVQLQDMPEVEELENLSLIHISEPTRPY